MTATELAERRKALGLSLSGLASALGVNRMTVYRWEHGPSRIPAFLDARLKELEQERRRSRRV